MGILINVGHLVWLAILGAMLVGVLSSPAAWAARRQAPDVDAALTEARRLITEDRPGEAIERLAALDAAGRPEVTLLRGVAFYHADDYLRAIEHLQGVVERLPDGSVEQREATQVLGLSLYLAGRIVEAVPRLEATRAWATDNLELAYILGNAYIQTRRPDRAREQVAATFGVDPESAAAHLLTAQMMIRLEFEAFAETELRRALEKDPRIPQAHLLLGQMALFRGRLEEAVTETERELAVNPGNAMALSQLGDAYVRQARWDDAIAALQRSLWVNPFYSAPYILLGRAYMRKGQPATAEGMLRRAIQYDPNNRSAHYLLAQLLQQAGRTDEAREHFEIAERLLDQPR